MKWRDGTIGDLVSLQRGHDLTEVERTPGDIPVIGSAGPNGFHNEAIAKGPGVTIGRSGGSIGKVTFVPADFWPHNTCIYVTDFKGNDPRFVSCLLGKINLAQLNSGAAQPSLNRNFVYGVKIRFPSPTVQKDIAEVLSAYDNLIENNRRRMQLLEESARLLYKEWFVHLRFPGHEHVKVTAGVPKGWEKKPLVEIAKLNYGKALKAETRIPGPIPVFGSSGIVGEHNTALATGPGIIVGRKGNVGSVFWSPTDFYVIDTAYFITATQSSVFLFYALQTLAFISTDVAVPGLNRDLAHSRLVLLPPRLLLELFEETLEPIRKQVTVLENHSAKLTQARDLLLPRLMSGELVA